MSEDNPQVFISVFLPHLKDRMDDPDVLAYVEQVNATTQTIALIYAAVLMRPSVLYPLFSQILRTMTEMFRDELEQAGETKEEL